MSDFERYKLIIEAVDAAAAVFLPILVALVSVLLYRYKKSIDHRLDAERESVARGALQFQKLSTLANDIYCFTVLVGHYREISPLDAVQKKREFEHLMYASLPMWNDRLVQAALDFVAACYVTQRGRGRELLLVSDVAGQREERGEDWEVSWEACFLQTSDRKDWINQNFGKIESYRKEVIMPRYAAFLAELSQAVGGRLSSDVVLNMLQNSGKRPAQEMR